MESEKAKTDAHMNTLTAQFQQLSEQFVSVTSEKVEHESTIKVKQEEMSAASQRIMVSETDTLPCGYFMGCVLPDGGCATCVDGGCATCVTTNCS